VSGLIPREFINEVLSRTDIIELIDARVPLKKAGRNHHACCPFHNEKTPSFTVSHVKQFYHCFGCGVSGNAIGFLMAYDRLEFVDAVEALAKLQGMEVPHAQSVQQVEKSKDLFNVLQEAKHFYQQQLKRANHAIHYLQQRGLSGEIAKTYAIGYAPSHWDALLRQIKSQELLLKAGLLIQKDNQREYYDRFRDRIMFPIRDRRGRVIGFGGRVLDNSLPKYLNSPETPLFHKSNVLYGIYEARQANVDLLQIIVVEGYMDVVALAQAGITFAVATLGTATTEQHAQQLFQHTNKIVFCFDGDRAGIAAAWRALEATLPMLQENYHAQFLFLPEGEDPDSLVRKEGKEAFLIRLSQAESLADFLFRHFKQQVNIGNVEGRAEFARLVLPYLEKIPGNILREMLLDHLAEVVRMDKSRLMTFVSHSEAKEMHEHLSKIQRTPMRLAIALVLQYPELAKQPTLNINLFTLPGSELLQQIFHLLQENPTLNTATLLEYWRDQKALPLLQKLAAWEHGVPENGIQAEWQGILKHLQQQQRQLDINNLVQKANQQQLSDDDKKHLQELLGNKNEFI
jgi:DNA primase